jgi:hypothetical protein
MIALATSIGLLVVYFVVIGIVTFYGELSSPPNLTDVQRVESMELPLCIEIPTHPPDAKDINIYNTLDEQDAVENFLGKTVSDAEALFDENALSRMQDLYWMGPVAFCYYVAAAINYIKSACFAKDSDAINGLFGMLEFRLDDGPQAIGPVIPQLRAAVQYIIENWSKFDADPEIYGDLRSQYNEMLKTLDA